MDKGFELCLWGRLYNHMVTPGEDNCCYKGGVTRKWDQDSRLECPLASDLLTEPLFANFKIEFLRFNICELTLESLPGAGVLPEPLRLHVVDPRLIQTPRMVIRVQEDAATNQIKVLSARTNQRPALPVQRLPQSVFLPQYPIKL